MADGVGGEGTQQVIETEAGILEISTIVSRSETSVVCLAERIGDKARVGLKFHADPAEAAREAAILRRLGGAPGPRLLGRHEMDGRDALIIEWVDGASLDEWAGADMPGGEDLRTVLVALAEAIGALHARGVAHRDLAPRHVIVEPGNTIRLIDFSAGAIVVEAGGAAVDPDGDGIATDIRGLGKLIQWLITGEAEIDRSRPGSDLPVGSEALLDLARDCQAQDPAQRPRDMRQIVERLRTIELPAITPSRRDPYPPTERIRAREPGVVPEPPAPPQPVRQRGRGARWGLTLVITCLVLAGAAFAGWRFGLPYYDRHYRLDWVVDPLGGGDARTVAEVLERGGADLTIRLVPGRHGVPPIDLRRVALLPADLTGERPVIVAEAGPCLAGVGAVLSATGLAFDATTLPASTPCILVEGGSLALTDIALSGDGATGGAGVAGSRGAALVIGGATLIGAGAEGIRLETGASALMERVTVEESGGAALSLTGGAVIEAAEVAIANPGGAGIAAGGGARLTLVGAQIEGAGGNGVSGADGAQLTLESVDIAGSAGAGIALYDGARLDLQNGALSRNALSGLFVEGAGALSLDTVGVLGNGEHGVVLLSLREGLMSSVDIQRNEGAGLAIFPAAVVTLEGTTVRENAGADILDGREVPGETAPEGGE